MIKSVKPIVIGVMTVLVVFGGVQSSSAAPSSCKRVGATKVQSAKMFTCVKNKKSGKLLWKRTPTTPTTTSTTSTIAVVVPRVLVAETMLTSGTWPKVVSVTSNVVGTVYLVEGASAVSSVADITRLRSELWMSAPITQVASPTTVAVDVDALTNGYYRVFVANSSGVLSAVATNKVTISVTRASTATTTTTVVVTCATGGTCVVGDTGPGGGVVFYVHDDADDLFTQTGATGSMCTTTCKYLEAAPANWLAGTTGDPTRSWADAANQSAPVTNADLTAIGSGYKNSLDIVAQTGNVAASSAAVLARAYAGGSKSDWHLPSKDELNELCKYARTQTTGVTTALCVSTGPLLTGFSAMTYWSSSEISATLAWRSDFFDGYQGDNLKSVYGRVRPVRAFG